MKAQEPEIFPGEKGFKKLAALRSFSICGCVTGARYSFTAGHSYYIDKRDMPKLNREDFDECGS